MYVLRFGRCPIDGTSESYMLSETYEVILIEIWLVSYRTKVVYQINK